jgi:hypothetical protein
MQGRDGLIPALLVPWLQRGAYADWERFRAAAVHNLDVDTRHPVARSSGIAGATHGPGVTHWSTPEALRWTYPSTWLDLYYLAGEPRALEMLGTLVNSLGDKTIGEFGREGRAWTPDQAGYLRARLAAHEALGEDHSRAALAALNFFAGLADRELGGHREYASGVAPALIRYHRLTGNPVAAALIIRGTRAYTSSRGPAGRDGSVAANCYEACAYAWRLTGDRYFLERARQLAAGSACTAAARAELESEAKPPPDLFRDARALLEIGALPPLRNALHEAARPR